MFATKQHYFTRREYLALYEQQILEPSKRTELINGEIIELSPLGHEHAKTQKLVAKALEHIFGDNVYITGSLVIGENMPEPDAYVVKPDAKITKYPTADQVSLVVEVSDTTLDSDLTTNPDSKLAIYAQGGIPEVLVIDIKGKRVFQFSEPSGTTYQKIQIHNESIDISNVELSVGNLIFS